MSGITDLDIRDQNGSDVLYSASGISGGVSSFNLTASGAQFLNQAGYAPANSHASSGQLEELSLGLGDTLAVLGQYGSTLQRLDLGGDGSLVDTGSITIPGGFGAPVVAMHQVMLGPETLIYASRSGVSGLTLFQPDGAGQLVQVTHQGGDTQVLGADVVALESVSMGSQTYLLAASAYHSELVSYRIEQGGALTEMTRLGADNGLGIAAPSALVEAVLDGQHYMVLAAAGSGTLSVIRLDMSGGLSLTDHVLDNLDSRFAGVSALETITIGDQVFLVAGGSDDGLSLLTLLPGGRLLHLGHIADDAQTSLRDISAIALRELNGQIEVFAAGEDEAGITHLRIDPGTLGATQIGEAGNDTLNGTAAGEVLAGAAGDDLLIGNAGDDILLDGAGSDTLRGGAGADIFVLSADAALDRIEGFELGVDRIDLSGLGYLRNLGQLTFQSEMDGVTILFGEEELRIVSDDFMPLTAADFSAGDLLDLDHLAFLTTPAAPPPAGEGDDTILGTSDADVLHGFDGSDHIDALDGDDLLEGGAGNDTLLGGSGNDRFVLSTIAAGELDVVDGGEGDADMADFLGFGAAIWVDLDYAGIEAWTRDGIDAQSPGIYRTIADLSGIEHLTGSNYHDLMSGDDNDNVLKGADGDDQLRGDGGDDLLDGGTGRDHLLGGAGNDRYILWESRVGDMDIIEDSSGDDTVDLSHFGAAVWVRLDYDGAEAWTRDAADLISTGNWRAIADLSGIDHLTGTAFDDILGGDSGGNLLIGGAGSDRIEAGGGNDRILLSTSLAGDLDVIHGEGGDDTIDFSGFGSAVWIWMGYSGIEVWTKDTNEAIATAGPWRGIAELTGIDHITGTAYDDWIAGDNGGNILEGGGGNDRFVFHDGHGFDRINGFEATNDAEQIDLSAISAITDFADLVANHMTQAGSDVVIDTGAGAISLTATNLADLLDGNDFLF